MTPAEAKTNPRIGFLGMGHMGSRMAQRLLDAGYQVAVYDRTPQHAQDLSRKGAPASKRPPRHWQPAATW